MQAQRGGGSSINIIFGMLVWLFCAIPLHELGHYFAAKRLALNNIHFSILKWRNIPYAIATIAEPDETLCKNPDKFHCVASAFQLMGGLFTIAGLLGFSALGFLTDSACLVLVVFTVMYMVWETVNPKHIKIEESKET